MKPIRTIFAFMAATLVLFSSTTFMVGVHFCAGTVKEVAFLSNADGCGHKNLPPCHRKMMESCCDDESLTHHGQGFESLSHKYSIDASTGEFLSVAAPIIISTVIPESNRLSDFVDYDIPIRSADLPVLLGTLLI